MPFRLNFASHVAASSVSVTESEKQKKKNQGQGTPDGTPLVVSVPASAKPLVQESQAENNNPPFYVSPLSKTVREVRDQNGPISSPLSEEENVDLGKTSTPTVAQIDATKHS